MVCREILSLPSKAASSVPQLYEGLLTESGPGPEFASFPVLLPMDPPIIRAYPREVTIAEKFNPMVVLDIRNSRMKDFCETNAQKKNNLAVGHVRKFP